MPAESLATSVMTCTFTAVFEEAAEGGYVAYVAEVPGIFTQGETIEEARENLREAAELVLESNREIAFSQFEGRGRRQERITVGLK